MPHKIEKKIVSQRIVKDEPVIVGDEVIEYDVMHEGMERGDVLEGKTYKFKTPESEHAIYLTINHTVLNHSTDNETIALRELFINCKDMSNFQWITALTRLISAIFRKGGDVVFIAEELRAVFSPTGGYWEKSLYHPSIVAKIGHIIELHMMDLGIIQPPQLTAVQKEVIAEKRAAFEDQPDDTFPEHAVLCKDCSTKAAVMMDGCLVCLSCGSSKCQ